MTSDQQLRRIHRDVDEACGTNGICLWCLSTIVLRVDGSSGFIENLHQKKRNIINLMVVGRLPFLKINK